MRRGSCLASARGTLTGLGLNVCRGSVGPILADCSGLFQRIGQHPVRKRHLAAGTTPGRRMPHAHARVEEFGLVMPTGADVGFLAIVAGRLAITVSRAPGDRT